jgi:hypothetical protein
MRPCQAGICKEESGVRTRQWFLTSRERGNPSTRLDCRQRGEVAWTEGNLLRSLVHGVAWGRAGGGRKHY